jgi:hypothetical protein
MTMKAIIGALAAWLLLTLGPAAQERRVALVIGNSSYQNVTALANPVNDATDLASALTRIGFEVTLATDLDIQGMRTQLRAFRDQASGADMAMVYFAGHGVEIEKQNYLIPVDARLESDSDVLFDTIPLDLISEAVSGATTLRMVLLDACRNNPFLGRIKSTGRAIGQGLSPFEPTGGTLVAYAAKGGTVALDGTGRNSPFMKGLLAHIEEPGLDIALMFRKVRDTVLLETGNRQEPFIYGSLPGREIYLVPPTEVAAVPSTDTPVSTAPATSAQEEFAWNLVKDTTDRQQLQDFIYSFPRGVHLEEALEKLRALPSDTAVAALPETPATPALEGRQLIIALQTELNRVGCYNWPIDGEWGNQSRRAVEMFRENAGVAVAATDPTPDLLDTLKSRSTVVCQVQPDIVAGVDAPQSVGDLTECVDLLVTASQLDPNGVPWDSAVQGDPEPDILISETTTGAPPIRCEDSYTCRIRIYPTSEMVSLRIFDYDRVKANELMGEGQCRIGGQCTFPNATVTMSGC